MGDDSNADRKNGFDIYTSAGSVHELHCLTQPTRPPTHRYSDDEHIESILEGWMDDGDDAGRVPSDEVTTHTRCGCHNVNMIDRFVCVMCSHTTSEDSIAIIIETEKEKHIHSYQDGRE